MSILRPQWRNKNFFSNSFVLTGGIFNLLNITDGPGMMKGGGFNLRLLATPTDLDLVITVDGDVILDEDLVDISSSVILLQKGPWTVVGTASDFDFEFQENVQLAFQSSLKMDIRNNGADDTVLLRSNFDYHRGI